MNANDILVVEDDTGIRQTIVECLEFEGYSVREAAGAEEAIDAIANGGAPALVLLDLVMPGMSGAQLLERLKAEDLTAGVPVVVMTAAIPALGRSLPEGDALLAKPFDLAELLGTLGRFLSPHGADRSPSLHV